MTDRFVVHATFTLERTYPYPPAKVFAAFATAEGKAAWFGGAAGKWKEIKRTFDFRLGGREEVSGAWTDGPVSTFEATYHNIVPDQRIVYSYAMRLDDRPISVSLATLQFKVEGTGTRLIVTEQGAFLDEYDDEGSRESGTAMLLDKLGEALKAA